MKRVLLAGGGTGGATVPLLAVAEQIKKLEPKTEFLFVGTKAGPERELVKKAGIKLVGMRAAKLRRYFSLRNFLDFFVFVASLIRAINIVSKFRPDLIFTVGGYVAVPVCWIGKLFGAKIVVHQQDAKVGLANRLVAPFAQVITTAFEQTYKEFYSGTGFNKKWKSVAQWVGNPVREEFFNKSLPYKDFFNLHNQLPILLITGGGTGANQINEVVEQALPQLAMSYQIIHLTGSGKNNVKFTDANYHPYEFLDKEWSTAVKLAHIVISRAGLNVISELSTLGKIAIIVPMPNSHQEENAKILTQTSSAVVLDKREFTPENLTRVINSLKFNRELQQSLTTNIQKLFHKNAAERIAKLILKLLS